MRSETAARLRVVIGKTGVLIVLALMAAVIIPFGGIYGLISGAAKGARDEVMSDIDALRDYWRANSQA